MSRWPEKEVVENPESSTIAETLSRSGGDTRPRVETEESSATPFAENQRERLVLRDQEFYLRASERETLYELARFRIIYESDIVGGVYSGWEKLAKADLQALRVQKLVRGVSLTLSSKERVRIYTLSVTGRELVKKTDPRIEREDQRLYSGFVKPREAQHDALLYRAFRLERERLLSHGDRVRKVVLDNELKKNLFSRQASQRGKKPFWEVQAEAAGAMHLPVVNGRVMIPDLRLEYENEQGEVGRADIEVATGNYREAHLAAKASAGFRVYSASGPASELSVDLGVRLKSRAFPDQHAGWISL